MKKLVLAFAALSIIFPAFAAIFYLKQSRPLTGGTYECIYDVAGRELVNYQQWSCKPFIEM